MPPPAVMQCMEIWGGNEPVESSVDVAGLDSWVFSRPCHDGEAGGDVHYVSSCATGRIVRLMLADVSGHGPAVSSVAGQLRSLMREHVNHLDQGAFVRAMNQRFTELSDDGCFATAVVNTFFAPTRRLTCCNAGHPSPLLYRRRHKRWSLLRISEIESDNSSAGMHNLPLGIEGMMDYEQFSLHLEVGDIVICYSDSLIEALTRPITPEYPERTMLGEEGLLDVIRQLDLAPAETFIPRMLERIVELAPTNLLDDDVTVLLFRSNGKRDHVPLKTRLRAPLRVVHGLWLALRRGERPPLPDLSIANLGGAILNSMSAHGDDGD